MITFMWNKTKSDDDIKALKAQSQDLIKAQAMLNVQELGFS